MCEEYVCVHACTLTRMFMGRISNILSMLGDNAWRTFAFLCILKRGAQRLCSILSLQTRQTVQDEVFVLAKPCSPSTRHIFMSSQPLLFISLRNLGCQKLHRKV